MCSNDSNEYIDTALVGVLVTLVKLITKSASTCRDLVTTLRSSGHREILFESMMQLHYQLGSLTANYSFYKDMISSNNVGLEDLCYDKVSSVTLEARSLFKDVRSV